jgi:hypothetical protein
MVGEASDERTPRCRRCGCWATMHRIDAAWRERPFRGRNPLGGAHGPQVVVRSQFCSLTFTPFAERLKRSPFEVASSLMTTPFSFLR